MVETANTHVTVITVKERALVSVVVADLIIKLLTGHYRMPWPKLSPVTIPGFFKAVTK